MEIRKEDSALLLLYMPEMGINDIRKKLDENDFHLKNTFHFGQKNEYSPKTINDFEYEFCFKIGELLNGYYRLDPEVFGTTHTFYIAEDINIKSEYFVAYRNISILPKIDKLVSTDVYISDAEDISSGHLPLSEYTRLIKSFPNTTELTKYTDARISQTLSNYFDGLGHITENYEQYLNRKTSQLVIPVDKSYSVSLTLFKDSYEALKGMLDKADAYAERDWQIAICNIVRVLYPKYILAKREQDIGSDGRNNKKPDFLLIDASGFVDILEIKKPSQQRLLSHTKYRNNYIADRDLSGAIVQVEKYIYTLNHGGNSLEAALKNRLSKDLPENLAIQITNPQGMLLMGRSNDLSADQKLDLEIIKRQYKSIVDIMTYDDLLDRLKNILIQLEKDHQ